MLQPKTCEISSLGYNVWIENLDLTSICIDYQYIPIFTRSEVKGNGLGTARMHDVHMEEQHFILQKLVRLDHS